MFVLTRAACVALLICSHTAAVLAQDVKIVSTLEMAVGISHELDTAAIRLHRLHHLDAKSSTDAAELRTLCRYESEISTPPPHKVLALTFDDGPEPVQTEYILDVLRRHQIQATFFMIGDQVKRYPELVAKVMAEGHHLIANHSWDHPNFHSIDVADQTLQVEKTGQELIGSMTQKFFRYPYGNATCETNDYLHKQGYKIVGWHIDSCDWAFDKTGEVDAKEAATCGVLPQNEKDYVGHVLSAMRAHNGGIVLMHEIHPNTLKTLEKIIDLALADGYSFESIDAAEFVDAMR